MSAGSKNTLAPKPVLATDSSTLTGPTIPVISLVTAVWNGADLLPRAAASVFRQTASAWEWLIVDDGSTDATAVVVAELADRDPRIRSIPLKRNVGLSAARNAALAVATGQLVAYLDHDDEFYPDHFANVIRWQNAGDVLVFQYDLQEDRTGHPRRGDRLRFAPSPDQQRVATGNIAVPLGVVHHRRWLEIVGVFDVRLPRSQHETEDCDLWRRFHAAGAVFRFVPAVSGCYYIRNGSLSRRLPRTGLRPS